MLHGKCFKVSVNEFLFIIRMTSYNRSSWQVWCSTPIVLRTKVCLSTYRSVFISLIAKISSFCKNTCHKLTSNLSTQASGITEKPATIHGPTHPNTATSTKDNNPEQSTTQTPSPTYPVAQTSKAAAGGAEGPFKPPVFAIMAN